ncbi:MAG: apolipoprotein N-acyltransferase [Deltaproteobacteria bacterium]|nr:apolipoprotein N-acyltransferase [Deltaproteobacteria bacterium]
MRPVQAVSQDQPESWRAQAWLLAGALASAALLVLASPGVTTWRWCALLAWIAFAPIAWVLPRVSMRRAALLGWVAGFALNAGLCSWFPGLLARFSGLHPALAVAASLVIWSWQALAWCAWALITRAVHRAPWAPLASAAAFVVIERWMPMVFPYSLGITQYRMPWPAQIAELGGPYLLTFLFVLTGSMIALAASVRRSSHRHAAVLLGASLAVPMVASAFGAWRIRGVDAARGTSASLRVGMVQASWVRTGWQAAPDPPEILGRYQDLSATLEREQGPLDLLIWPEKAYPLLLRHDAAHDYPSGHERRIRRGFRSPLLFGVTAVDVSTREITNSAAFADSNDRMQVFYDKVQLIPYSEWLPGMLSPHAGGGKRYRAGNGPQLLALPSSRSLGAFICFESIFPAYMRTVMRGRPDLLVNLSDDAWFGDGAEPEQHLAQVVFRAIESRRDLVRSTGSGISAHVASTGRILATTQLSRQGEGTTLVVTPKVGAMRSWYGWLGDAFPWACLLVVIAAIAARRSIPAARV